MMIFTFLELDTLVFHFRRNSLNTFGRQIHPKLDLLDQPSVLKKLLSNIVVVMRNFYSRDHNNFPLSA